jgi:tetratricopeptide (TPR) repeat protein
MSLAVLLTFGSVLVPAPSGPQDGWTGQIVMPKQSFVSCRSVSSGDDTDIRLMLIEYRVIKDQGADVLIFENGKEVLVSKENLVPQSEAVGYYSELIQKEPSCAAAYAFRGWAHKQQKNFERALDDYKRAIDMAPSECAWWNNRALVWIEKKDYDKAIADYDQALRLFPQYALGYRNRGNCWLKKKEYANALKDFQKSVEFGPEAPLAHSSLARLLASCPDAKIRDGKQAVEAATRACEICDWKIGAMLDTLAAAYAEAGRFDEAVKYQERAFADPDFMREKDKVEAARKRLLDYRNNKAFRDDRE